jgi:tRNA pseudouridine65 synthase
MTPSARIEHHGAVHVLARGAEWVVVAKPPRVIVHRNAQMPHEYAMVQWVRDSLGCPVWPAHRLDRPASGAMLFALRQDWAGPLSLAIAEGHKSYLAFVRGFFEHEDEVTVETPIKSGNGPAKAARSHVSCLARSHEPRCSLLRVRTDTGRHHQVRRHVRDLDHPILHDGDHGDSRVNQSFRERFGLTRLGLHAESISLELPHGEGVLNVRCPLFEDHVAVFEQMPWWSELLAAHPELGAPAIPVRRGQLGWGSPGREEGRGQEEP